MNWHLHQIIDLDLKSYFDSVRHDLMLSKLAKRIRDRDLLWLCKAILKSGGKRGLPQGSVIGPLWANVFLNDVDRMLEQAQTATKQGPYETVRYTRFADDLAVLINSHPRARHWSVVVERRLREELAKLDLVVNEDKTRVVDFGTGVAFDFLGYTFRPRSSKNCRGKLFVSFAPAVSEQAAKAMRQRMRRWRLHHRNDLALEEIAQWVHPVLAGWVRYYGQFHSSTLRRALRTLDDFLVRWAQRKYKRLRTHRRRAWQWLWRVHARQPDLFAHWALGSTVGR